MAGGDEVGGSAGGRSAGDVAAGTPGEGDVPALPTEHAAPRRGRRTRAVDVRLGLNRAPQSLTLKSSPPGLRGGTALGEGSLQR